LLLPVVPALVRAPASSQAWFRLAPTQLIM